MRKALALALSGLLALGAFPAPAAAASLGSAPGRRVRLLPPGAALPAGRAGPELALPAAAHMLSAVESLTRGELDAEQMAAMVSDVQAVERDFAEAFPESAPALAEIRAEAEKGLAEAHPSAVMAAARRMAWALGRAASVSTPETEAAEREVRALQPRAQVYRRLRALSRKAGNEDKKEGRPKPPKAARPEPARPLTQRLLAPFKLAYFAAVVVALFRGAPPVMAQDMDGTIAPDGGAYDPVLLKTDAEILRLGGRQGLLTGSSKAKAEAQALEPLRRELGKDGALRTRFPLGASSGAEIYAYDPAQGSYRLAANVDLATIAEQASGRPGEGALILQTIRRVMAEAALVFDFQAMMTRLGFAAPKGNVLLSVTNKATGAPSQLVLVPTGVQARNDDKKLFDKLGGRRLRTIYAAFINRRLKEERIGLEARVAGASSLDIGAQKGSGLRKLVALLFAGLPAPRPGRRLPLIYRGDSFGHWENDKPAGAIAAVSIDVGDRGDADHGGIIFTEKGAGPRGLRPYDRVIAWYARLSTLYRAVLKALLR